jgi:hypothetical protein
MKKLGIGLFIGFFFIASIYAVIQSNLGRNYIRSLFTNALQQSGYTIKIDQVEGTLPHQIDLKGVSIQGKGLNLTIEKLELRPILWRLLTKEAAFKDVHAKAISISESAPFDFNGRFRIDRKRAIVKGQVEDWNFFARLDLQKNIALFTAHSALLNLKGNATFDAEKKLKQSNIQMATDRLPFSAHGRFLANLIIRPENEAYKGKIHWQIPNLQVDEMRIGKVKGTGEVLWENRTLQGFLTIDPLAKADFKLEILPQFLLSGTTEINIENLQSLHIPNSYGKLNAKAQWKVVDNTQLLHLDLTADEFYYKDLYAQKASLYTDLNDPFKNFTGLLDLEVEKAKWRDLEIENGSLETKSGEKNWDFKLFAEGKWKHPLEVHMDGTWQDTLTANIENLNGTFFSHPFELANPVRFEITKERFSLPNVEIAIAGATAFLHIDRFKDQTDAKLEFKKLPIDFLSLNPLDVSIDGKVDLLATVKEKNNRLQGTLKASVDQMEVSQLGLLEKMIASGNFEGKFDRDLLKLKGDLLVSEKPIFNLDLSLPIHFSVWPFQAQLLSHKEAKGVLDLHGRAEDFLDFFNLGPHRLEGQCDCTLRFSNTLSRPFVEGTLRLQDGFYQNYYTGTELHNIQADCIAKKNTIYLSSLTAQDPHKSGNLKAEGSIQLLADDQYPFNLDIAFENLKFVEIDLVTSTATGKVHLEGNRLSAIAKGDVHILKSDLNIPDHIPRPLPNLQVTYRNSIHPVPPPQTDYKPYPLYLDLHVLAPKSVSISGRGLTSEWKGDFHLGGTFTELAAKGKLELIDGEFNFSSRSFKLTDGSLSLSGKEHEMPYLNLAGSMETKGITITARLKGPLNDPQVTLQSIPALPLGSIMSYLLFGQDVSEISGFQALQLATSLAGLAGTGPDVMESTRRSLGVDRLRVITDPTEEGGETVSLEVGKYVSKGVLVSFTQGTDDSSTNISVEIELRGNLVFQIQSDQHQEQGKFTLKWNVNY